MLLQEFVPGVDIDWLLPKFLRLDVLYVLLHLGVYSVLQHA